MISRALLAVVPLSYTYEPVILVPIAFVTAALANFEPTGNPAEDKQAIRKSLGDDSGFSSYQVQMYEVWPKTIAATPLSYDATNSIVKTSVTFTYRNFATSAWNYLADRSAPMNREKQINRHEYRTNTTAIQASLLDNLPFGLGSEVGRIGRQVYEKIKRNLPIP